MEASTENKESIFIDDDDHLIDKVMWNLILE